MKFNPENQNKKQSKSRGIRNKDGAQQGADSKPQKKKWTNRKERKDYKTKENLTRLKAKKTEVE